MSGGVTCLNGGIAYPAPGSSKSADVRLECRCTKGWQGRFCEEREPLPDEAYQTVFKICLCIFLLIILPSIVFYAIRTLYLMLKRCGVLETLDPLPTVVERRSPSRRMTVKFADDPYALGRSQFRAPIRTISLPITTAVVLTEPVFIAFDGKRLHRTTTWHAAPGMLHQTASDTSSPPPPPYPTE